MMMVGVKSSTEVSEIYLEDVAFQYYVLTMCEVPVKGVYILYIDNTYVRGEQLDLKGLFVLEECTDMALRKFYEIKSDGRLNLMMEYVKSHVHTRNIVENIFLSIQFSILQECRQRRNMSCIMQG